MCVIRFWVQRQIFIFQIATQGNKQVQNKSFKMFINITKGSFWVFKYTSSFAISWKDLAEDFSEDVHYSVAYLVESF